jgi:hypothetical protein
MELRHWIHRSHAWAVRRKEPPDEKPVKRDKRERRRYGTRRLREGII